MLELYTDGACLDNPHGPGGWGVVAVRDGRVAGKLSGSERTTTNNRMEITAVIRGLEKTGADEPVAINSDSQYVVNTMTRGWKRKANQDLWAELDGLVAGRRVEWNWVRGHAGNEFNELADRLAVDAAESLNGGSGSGNPGGNLGGNGDSTTPPVLSHLDGSGQARMVDVGGKDITDRVAVARGSLRMKPETLELIREGGFEKGDVLGTARLAGVVAAKRTSELIPLCHPVPLTQITVEFDDDGADRLEIEAKARASWKTGVEMEALTAVSVAALTVYDMCKSVDRGMRIEDMRLVRKSGGRSGDYVAEEPGTSAV